MSYDLLDTARDAGIDCDEVDISSDAVIPIWNEGNDTDEPDQIVNLFQTNQIAFRFRRGRRLVYQIVARQAADRTPLAKLVELMADDVNARLASRDALDLA